MKKGQHLKTGEKPYFNHCVNANTDPESLGSYVSRYFGRNSQVLAKNIVRNKTKKNKMRAENFNIHNVIDHLQGTCMNTLDSAISELYEGMGEEDLTEEELAAVDNEIFECATCGWWCEMSENAETDDGEMHCQECAQAES